MREIRLLGDVAVVVDGRVLDLGPAKQRCVLAVLAVDAGRVVSVQRLIDRVWGDHPPLRARQTLLVYLSHLRRLLVPTGVAGLARRSGGYVLEVDSLVVDLGRFRDRCARAHAHAGDDRRVAALLEEALQSWSGEALTGLDGDWATGERERLHQERLTTERDLTDALLRSGYGEDLVPGLMARTTEQPLNERVAGQLMLALHRAGRTVDALAHYRQLRERLVEQLGIDPGTALQELHQRILDADPTLISSSTAAAQTPVSVSMPVPRQLPAPPRLFTGRSSELSSLDELLTTAPDQSPLSSVPSLSETGAEIRVGALVAGTVVISVIGGVGGVGKTWLALTWAHRHAEAFPDGQLFVDLRGFSPTEQPIPPDTALSAFLTALGVTSDSIPADLDAKAGLFRSLVSGKRMLILLDNASDTAQVLPLIPGSPSCAVLITSRRRLTGLTTGHGAIQLDLDVLTDSDAHDLLVSHLGPRPPAAEPATTTELLSYCGGLPLAIGIVAARATAHPTLPLAALAAELRDHTARLDALDGGDQPTDLRAVLAWSYDALSPEAADTVGLLALAPGPDISLLAASSLTGLPAARARTVLRELEQAHLVQQHTHGRYRMHDLVRLSATEHAHRRHTEPGRLAALHRLAGFYLHTAHAGERCLDPSRPAIDLVPPVQDSSPTGFTDHAEALAWFAAEHSNLLACHPVVARHWPDIGWQMAWTMDNFHVHGGYIHDAVTVWETGLTAAHQTGRSDAHVVAHRLLGRAHALAGPLSAALRHLRVALELAERVGDRLSQGRIHITLAMIWQWQGDHQQALRHSTEALGHYRAVDVEVWLVDPLLWVGACHAQLDHHDLAGTHAQQGLELADRHHQRSRQAHALDILGQVAHRTGRFDEALDRYGQALTIVRDLGNAFDQSLVLEHLAETHLAVGDIDRARTAWLQALDFCWTHQRKTEAEVIQARLTTLDSVTAATTG